MKLHGKIIAAIVLLAFLIPAQSARADVAPPVAPILSGLEPFHYQDTKVQMVYERVEMELQESYNPGLDSMQNRVSVTASFVMRNQGSVPETMQAIFPLESLTNCAYQFRDSDDSGSPSYTYYEVNKDSFNISIDGNSAATSGVTTNHPYQHIYSECKKLNWIGFDVTFPVNTDVAIIIKYSMETTGVDDMQSINYVLETGSGWYGPIERAYVIVKFPYMASNENILEDTTPGYQMLYNEIFWSFQNLEPTSKDNIRVSIVSPDTWQYIMSNRQNVKENPANSDAWLNLAKVYHVISVWHGYNLRNLYYYNLIAPTYQRGISANPNSADLHAYYAEFLQRDCCFYYEGGISDSNLNKILAQVNLALALNPAHPVAIRVLGELKSMRAGLVFTPPPTIPPTETPVVSSTPTVTPSPSITPKPSQTPVVITVVNTKIVTTTPQKTATPAQTLTATPSPTPTFTLTPENWLAIGLKLSSSLVTWPLLLLLGLAAGIFISKKKWI